MLSRDEILNAKDLPTETVNVPEWGGSVKIRSITAFERDSFEQSIIDGKKTNMSNIRARFCALIIVDDKGDRVFGDLDMAILGRKSGKALGRIFDAGQKLNGFSKEDFEELEKNSGKTPTDDLPTT